MSSKQIHGIVASLACLCCLIAGCSDSIFFADVGGPLPDSGPPADHGALPDQQAPAPDQGLLPDATVDSGGPSACPRVPGPADGPRKVVVSRPYAGSTNSDSYEVLELSAAGKLSQPSPPVMFDMMRTAFGRVHFTRDGEVGLVAQDDGSIGVFSFAGGGGVQVVHKAFKASGYVSALRVAPSGDVVYALSSQWRKSGGGIYRIRINCDGTLTDEGLVAPAKLPYTMSFIDDTRALVVARDILESKAGDEVHLVDFAGKPALLGGAPAFGDDKAIVSFAALSPSGKHLLITDNGMFAGNRLAAVSIGAGGLPSPAQLLDGIKDPVGVVFSPHDNAAMVLGAQANLITVFDYDSSKTTDPLTVRGPLATSSKPLLPGEAVMIRRGSLLGRVITAENVAMRQLQFKPSGEIDEIELFSTGEESADIPGTLGIQP